MVPIGANSLVRIEPNEGLAVVAELPQAQLDGVVVAGDGSILVSSFGANAVYQVDSTGTVHEIISNTPVADIGIDVERNSILIPQLDANRLVIHPVALNERR